MVWVGAKSPFLFQKKKNPNKTKQTKTLAHYRQNEFYGKNSKRKKIKN